ncbi:class I adenylate-forming enzyme family protein [Mycobacterium sp. 852013-50091_SCH5140682]|uniref:class I adenylate-forming enzyme family protein n=1 Tax=Mycobacterium sp. 852013-50091_SCH5140682 TaxID=1834109 RepID=UPI000A72ACA8|nr:class I adenylate-forming enzyme family protein [Mycobacterium sp. 852013-50091_SCH5140682]
MSTVPPPDLGATELVQAYREGDRSEPLASHTVGGLLASRAAEHPDREALVGIRHGTGETERVTYTELLEGSRRVAAALAELAEPGDYVALWAPNVIEWTFIQYGAALAGVVLVALNPVLRDGELDYALRHSRARVLLHADVSREYVMSEVATRVCAGIPGIRRISLSEQELWMAPAPSDSVVDIETDSPVMLQYTSGTTGRPKGVLLTHRALVNVARLTMEATGVAAGAVCFNPLPLFHTAGCVIATIGPLWVAGTSILCERFTPDATLEALLRESVSVLFYVPTVLLALLQRQRQLDTPAPRLRIIMGGASSVSSELIDGATSVFGAEVYNLYGQTELAPVLSLTRPGDSRHDQLTTVGRPLPHLDCKIVDPDSGATLGVGEVGEICARGDQQFLEYLHDPDATARALDSDGFVRTGDLGAMDHRGYLTVTGRLKELIIRGGENISPAEVEAVLAAHDDVLDVVAVGLPDEKMGEIVAAVCRIDHTREGLRERLVEHARAHMPSYKVPARWFVIEDFPMTPTGKIQRFALREAICAQELDEL